MGKHIDLSGKVFGRLTVISHVGSDKHRNKTWSCLCQCGKELIVVGMNLIKGTTKSCGCYKNDVTRFRTTTHGHTTNYKWSREYECWKGMVRRCTKVNSTHYRNYGGRGITVCERWLESFENFYEDMGSKPSPDHSIERDNVNGNYTPDNCRWATNDEQSWNKRKLIRNTSGTPGVSWNKRDSRWIAHIGVFGKRMNLGSFRDHEKEKAIEARRQAEIKYWNKQPS